ncbi:hypothetical protein L596_021721 [Steinernema carpocapsae]|uniref:Uncharacterized protein n=1 Tax=Steinernema carpocapsae TaxID=34508 RepID=A0A4U5MJP4_STECR|nr:hypothetical protein L596_021721 [Steinernema carpocapsae]
MLDRVQTSFNIAAFILHRVSRAPLTASRKPGVSSGYNDKEQRVGSHPDRQCSLAWFIRQHYSNTAHVIAWTIRLNRKEEGG